MKKSAYILVILLHKYRKKGLPKKSFSVVIRLGLEPKTPTLKVLCSTS